MAVFSKIAAGALAFAGAALALNPISANGTDFVDSVTGDRFEIIGVAYQPGGSAGFNPGSGIDPLSNGTQCLRDAAIMQTLGVNAIRVYNLDPATNHDDCVGIFDSVGIYMLIDVNSPLQGQSLDAAQPWTTYTKDYLTRVFQVIEAFKNYDNLIGFFSGNEVINDDNSGGIDPPYIRAVTRDMKNYIAKQANRTIPVGYSAADVRDILVDTSNYLQCTQTTDGSADPSRIDFFGLNSYSWCGNSTMGNAGYDTLVSDFQSSTIPVFFSEYGCNAVMPRDFTEVQAIYGPDMTPPFSGGLVYEYSQETNDFGLVKIAGDSSAQLLQDFDNLQAQFNNLNQSSLSNVTANTTAPNVPQCDSSLIKTSSFSTNFTLPSIPDGVQDMIDNGVPNAKTGSMTTPTATSVPMPVYDSSNNQISNLAISMLPNNAANVPSGKNSTGADGPKAAAVVTTSMAASATGNSTSGGSGSGNVGPSPTASKSAASATASSAAGKVEMVSAGSLLALGAAVVAFL